MLSFSGTTFANGIDWQQGFVEVDGYGAPPAQAFGGQANLLAQRAAKVDCYRNMLELVSGVRVDAQSTVKDLMVQSDFVHTQVAGLVKEAQVVRTDRLYDGSFHMIMRAPLYGVIGLQSIVNITPATEAFNPDTAKIILDKMGDQANLVGSDVHTNLNWYHGDKNRVSPKNSVDLDIGCFYEAHENKEVLDALNKRFGDYNNEPYISIDVDDRTGNVASGENLRINGQKLGDFKRILIYSYIYKGISNWSAIDGVVTVQQSGKPDIIIRLDQPDTGNGTCAIAVIEKVSEGNYKIMKLGEYFDGRPAMDDAYHWGFNWREGRKNV